VAVASSHWDTTDRIQSYNISPNKPLKTDLKKLTAFSGGFAFRSAS